MMKGKKYEIAHAETFPLELGRSPRKVMNAYSKLILPVLQDTPDIADPPRIKPLNGYKNLWRMRVSDDYRVVYRVEKESKTVIMLMLDHRSKIYDRLGSNDDGEPGIRIVAKAEDLLEREPSPEEVGQAYIELAEEVSTLEEHCPDNPLPLVLTSKILTEWAIPGEYHQAITNAKTEGTLLKLDKTIPESIIERIINNLWPKKIEEIVQEPIRIATKEEDLAAAVQGERDLASFILKLDRDQKAFVSRFERPNARGPWLLKGGPGSGKSIIALYCIRSIIRTIESQLPLGNKPLKILLTTFTNSLINSSDHLLASLSARIGKHQIDVKTVDSLAYNHLPDTWRVQEVISNPLKYVQEAVIELKKNDPKLGFSVEDANFISEEIDWVLIGQDLSSLEEYLEADRTGRRRALSQQQRQQIWSIFQATERNMRREGKCLFSERVREAAGNSKPQYDYVFIDEAQDLKPVAIRFCIKLCRDPRNVFLTADSNQSIYGSGLSWSKVADDLRFQGKARILRRNYRTTTEIWQAISQLAPQSDETDIETLDVETVYRGPYPILARYSSLESASKRLNSYLHEALLRERASTGCAAILCPTNHTMELVMDMVSLDFNPKAMKSQDLDLTHPGVKVTTMHASKGLEFPVVAVFGVEDGVLPRPPGDGIDPSEHEGRQRRLLFVACSRAMRSLIVFGNRDRPSPFIEGISDQYWEMEDL